MEWKGRWDKGGRRRASRRRVHEHRPLVDRIISAPCKGGTGEARTSAVPKPNPLPWILPFLPLLSIFLSRITPSRLVRDAAARISTASDQLGTHSSRPRVSARSSRFVLENVHNLFTPFLLTHLLNITLDPCLDLVDSPFEVVVFCALELEDDQWRVGLLSFVQDGLHDLYSTSTDQTDPPKTKSPQILSAALRPRNKGRKGHEVERTRTNQPRCSPGSSSARSSGSPTSPKGRNDRIGGRRRGRPIVRGRCRRCGSRG
jgi:hypothetical protein